MKTLAKDTYELLRHTVLSTIQDCRMQSYKLVTGRIDSSPFSPFVLADLRDKWERLLPEPESAHGFG